jgi:hypothetical protein
MTIVCLERGDLFIYSPTCLVSELKTEIEKMGTPRWIIGPNRIHYWWIPEWRNAFPNAKVYLAPRIRERAGRHIDFDCFTLDKDTGYPWDAEIATLPIAGSFMAEFEFFHQASRAHSDRFDRKFRAEETKLVHYPLVNPTSRSAGSRRPDAARHATDFLQEETATSGGNQKNACLESRMHHSG